MKTLLTKTIRSAICIIIATIALISDLEAQGVEGYAKHYTFTSGGYTRNYLLYLPKDLPVNAPLIIAAHGYGGSAKTMETDCGFDAIADSFNFAVCYPNGYTDHWNIGYQGEPNPQINDSVFMRELAVNLQTTCHLSKVNTFFTGLSNGGDLCNMLACKEYNTFKAVGAVVGCMMKWLYDLPETKAAPPIPFLMVNSTADSITWWNGDSTNAERYFPYLSTYDDVKFWAAKNGCTTFISQPLPHKAATTDGSSVILEKYTGGVCDVWLYKVINGSHNWPGSGGGNMDFNASLSIWDFFKLQIKREVSGFHH